MTGEPTVLGMINSKLNDISCDLKDIKKDLKDGAVRMENHNGRLKNVENNINDLKNGQKKIKETVYNHANDKELHYNQGYKETFAQRTWRRKDLIATLTGIFALISWLINNYFGGP